MSTPTQEEEVWSISNASLHQDQDVSGNEVALNNTPLLRPPDGLITLLPQWFRQSSVIGKVFYWQGGFSKMGNHYRVPVRSRWGDTLRIFVDDTHLLRICRSKVDASNLFGILSASDDAAALLRKINEVDTYLLEVAMVRCREDRALGDASVLPDLLDTRIAEMGGTGLANYCKPLLKYTKDGNVPTAFLNISPDAKFFLVRPPSGGSSAVGEPLSTSISLDDVKANYLGTMRARIVIDISHVKICTNTRVNIKVGFVISQVKILEKVDTGIPTNDLFLEAKKTFETLGYKQQSLDVTTSQHSIPKPCVAEGGRCMDEFRYPLGYSTGCATTDASLKRRHGQDEEFWTGYELGNDYF